MVVRIWDGRAVRVNTAHPDSAAAKPVGVYLTAEAAGDMIKTLGRVEQTTFALPGSLKELKQALEYVLVGDDASVRAHLQMEAGKGMTPDGGR
jgi:hypothetical protein